MGPVTRTLYVASAESVSGKSAVAVGLLAELCARGGRVGVFRPIVQAGGPDALAELLHPLSTSQVSVDRAVGVTYDEVNLRTESAISTIVDRFHAFAAEHDTVLVVGSDYTGVPAPAEFSTNAAIAAHLGAAMVLVVPAVDREVEESATAALVSLHEAQARHAEVVAVIANRVPQDQVGAMQEELDRRLRQDAEAQGDAAAVPRAFTLPADDTLAAPTVRDLMTAADGTLLAGDEALLDRETSGLLVAGMTMPHVLDRLREGNVLICPGDREEVLIGAILAHSASTFPSLSAIVLNGGFRPSQQVSRLVEGISVELPIITCEAGTMRAAMTMYAVRGRITPHSTRKIDRARALVHEHLDLDALVGDGTEEPTRSSNGHRVVTPLMFEHQLVARARSADAHIVLPEGMEDRILRAADTLLARKVARLTLLGNEAQVRERAAALGLHLDAAEVVDPETSTLRERFAATYAELRSHKG